MTSLELQIESQLRGYLHGDMQLEEFRRWFVPIMESSDLARTIEALIARFQDGTYDETSLKTLIERQLANPPPEADLSEFGRFKEMTRKLVAVPKTEIDERRALDASQ